MVIISAAREKAGSERKNTSANKRKVIDLFDYCFAENGLTAYRLGEALPSNNFIQWLGEEKYKKMANFILHHIADLDIPIKRYELLPFPCELVLKIDKPSGTFIEFRNGMINVSPIGRNASYYSSYSLHSS